MILQSRFELFVYDSSRGRKFGHKSLRGPRPATGLLDSASDSFTWDETTAAFLKNLDLALHCLIMFLATGFERFKKRLEDSTIVGMSSEDGGNGPVHQVRQFPLASPVVAIVRT